MDDFQSETPQLQLGNGVQNVSDSNEKNFVTSEVVKYSADQDKSFEEDTNSETGPVLQKVNSESKFGILENISLDASGHESINLSIPSQTTIETDTKQTDDPTQDAASANLLSKYFNTNVPEKNTDSDGINFFNTLGNGSISLESNQMNESAVNVQEIKEKDGNTSDAPPLLKFFSEDKSGKDRDGSAFFDKISGRKLTENLSISESILTSSPESFLRLPIGGDIEDAWLPSEKTRQVLMAIVTSKSSIQCEESQLTRPTIVVDNDMVDPIKALLIECKSPVAQERHVLSAADVNPDEAGLMKLMEAGCYHAAVNLTKQILINCYQINTNDAKPIKHTPFSLRVWYIRLALFVKLRKFNLAEAESAAFGDFDRPDLYYEYSPDIYNEKRGSMVPFAFRLLLAELPQYQGNNQVTLDNLYHILNIVQKIIQNVDTGCAEDGSMIELSESRKNTSLLLWRERERQVLYSILNCVLAQKDYVLAVSITKLLISKSKDKEHHLYSALGRIYLQLGDVNSAQECFTKADLIAHHKSENFVVEENINKALLAVSQNNNEEAYKFYENAYTLNKDNAMIVNNMAVCLLYMGKLRNSLNLLEETIQSNPEICLHDGLLFNICTLYELESSRCAEKKIAMLELLSKHVGDSFNISCLKIQSSIKV